MSSCPGTFAVAKNPNNALIWPVQFCRATSVCVAFGLLRGYVTTKQNRTLDRIYCRRSPLKTDDDFVNQAIADVVKGRTTNG
jgi:hypothetical protein